MHASPRRAVASAATLVLLVGLVACGPTHPEPGPVRTPTPSPTPVARAELRLPSATTTVLSEADPVLRAVAASGALFVTAPVAVVAPSDDLAAQLRAASVAVAVGGPLLLVGADPGPTAAEIDRLDVQAVLTVGAVPGLAAAPVDATVLAAPADDASLGDVLRESGTGTWPGRVVEVAPGAEVAAVASLDAAAPVMLSTPAAPADPTSTDPPSADPPSADPPSTDPSSADPPGTPDPDAPTSAPTPPGLLLPTPGGTLPRTGPPPTPAGALVLATGDVSELAPVATARAAGHPVVVVPGGDPRASAASVEAVAAAHRGGRTTHVLAAGPGLGAPERLAWTVATAATGVQLPGGGQLPFAGRRMVALYGTPAFAGLGLLGEQDAAAGVVRAQGLAAEYQALTDDVVVPTFEIIATIASAAPGEDGNYSNELAVESLLPWVEAAGRAGVYVILDLQPGRTDFLTQARAYEPLLRHPHVGLALDPEWRLAPDQVHLRQIGSVGIDEVNAVVSWLADLTRAEALPQKVLVLHQFTPRMIQGRERLDVGREELAIVLHVDGQGSQPAKAGTWAALQVGAPAGVRWGWKNFVDEDVPMLTPAQTYGVAPLPDLVTYQ
ncbi:MAG TPA: hypothetical protein VN257_08735 [Actinotalea sp.]|nr:hypothetical protein [Actinotalea sp.]